MSKIYIITNDINDKVYVGKTEFSIEKRFQEHCRDCLKERCEKRPLYAAMRKYGTEHFSIRELESCSTEDAPLREQYWIGFYKGYEEGYNATFGGDGKAYIDRDELLRFWQQGLTISEISKKTKHDNGYISKILKEKGITTEEIYQRGHAVLIKEISKSVEMLDKHSEEVIKTFSSTRDAARYLIQEYGLDPKNEGGYSSHISQACNGKRKTCQGYKWRYANL